jgi:hypothetical protein
MTFCICVAPEDTRNRMFKTQSKFEQEMSPLAYGLYVIETEYLAEHHKT